jgi:hypothetical protein
MLKSSKTNIWRHFGVGFFNAVFNQFIIDSRTFPREKIVLYMLYLYNHPWCKLLV